MLGAFFSFQAFQTPFLAVNHFKEETMSKEHKTKDLSLLQKYCTVYTSIKTYLTEICLYLPVLHI
jgi:hypothetical protein